jgi:hypothetical protein
VRDTLLHPPQQFGLKINVSPLNLKTMAKPTNSASGLKTIKAPIRSLDPNNIVPVGFLKDGEYRLDFNASSKFETATSKAGKDYLNIECAFTDSKDNTMKGKISEYQLPALMKDGKLVLGEGMRIAVSRTSGSTFADITLLSIGTPVAEVVFDGE